MRGRESTVVLGSVSKIVYPEIVSLEIGAFGVIVKLALVLAYVHASGEWSSTKTDVAKRAMALLRKPGKAV
jgi:predicted transporter